ncbi:MAG: hypothetical protein R2867_17455 [Caldilineaceae bacterium]
MLSNRPDLSQFQCNGCLAAAKRYGRNPRELAQEIADRLQSDSHFREVSSGRPGGLSIPTVTDASVTTFANWRPTTGGAIHL